MEEERAIPRTWFSARQRIVVLTFTDAESAEAWDAAVGDDPDLLGLHLADPPRRDVL